jgi:ABC-type uncharacterized transport system substrate-binding protein
MARKHRRFAIQKIKPSSPKRRGPRAATYVYRILCGADPTELPVQISIKFVQVINLKPAKALGAAVPSPLLWPPAR